MRLTFEVLESILNLVHFIVGQQVSVVGRRLEIISSPYERSIELREERYLCRLDCLFRLSLKCIKGLVFELALTEALSWDIQVEACWKSNISDDDSYIFELSLPCY